MTLDLKLAFMYYGLALALLVMVALLAGMRFIINHAFASSGHAFYVIATQQEPECVTCPFNKRCPYSNGTSCRFAKQKEVT
jgi:hypothetical protein